MGRTGALFAVIRRNAQQFLVSSASYASRVLPYQPTCTLSISDVVGGRQAEDRPKAGLYTLLVVKPISSILTLRDRKILEMMRETVADGEQPSPQP